MPAAATLVALLFVAVSIGAGSMYAERASATRCPLRKFPTRELTRKGLRHFLTRECSSVPAVNGDAWRPDRMRRFPCES
jgi:hypothetical protein